MSGGFTATVLIAMVLAHLFGVTNGAVAMPDLADYRWQNRLLLVFAPSLDDDAYGRQIHLLDPVEDGLEDRDMVIIEAVGQGPVAADGEPMGDLSAPELRRRFDVADDAFASILVGKDGEVKLRAAHPVPPERLFSVIDAMPMRQREMRGG